MISKTCKKCSVTKPVEEFYRDNRSGDKDRYLTICKECIKARKKKWNLENKERIREYNQNEERIKSSKSNYAREQKSGDRFLKRWSSRLTQKLGVEVSKNYLKRIMEYWDMKCACSNDEIKRFYICQDLDDAIIPVGEKWHGNLIYKRAILPESIKSKIIDWNSSWPVSSNT